MGFKLTLSKNNNFMNTTFRDAYWKIDNVGIGSQNNIFGIYYELKCYPTRDASKIDGQTVPSLNFGGSFHYNFETTLYQFEDFVPAEEVFGTNPIPSNIDEIKSILYVFVKNKLNLQKAIDVFEE